MRSCSQDLMDDLNQPAARSRIVEVGVVAAWNLPETKACARARYPLPDGCLEPVDGHASVDEELRIGVLHGFQETQEFPRVVGAIGLGIERRAVDDDQRRVHPLDVCLTVPFEI